MNPELSIIVTSYKNPRLLDLCLKSLKENVENIHYEIIVADAVTEEETEDLMREQHPDVSFLPHKKNVGFSKLVNAGVGKASGDYFFVINADIVIKKQSVEKILDYIKNNPDVGIAGLKLINFDNSIQPSCFRFYTPLIIAYRRTFLQKFSFARKALSRFLMEDVDKTNGPVETDWLMGSALALSRKTYNKIGEMGPGFFMYFEDVDWCWRCWEQELKVVYHPGISAYHYHGSQSANRNSLKAIIFNKYTRIHIYSGMKFFWKHLGKKNPRLEYYKKANQKK